jgi:hypothetical protein
LRGFLIRGWQAEPALGSLHHHPVNRYFRNLDSDRVPKRSQSDRDCRPVLEILEDRTLLSTLSFTGRALLWNGFGIGTANIVSVSVANSNYVLHDAAETIHFGAGVPTSWSGNNTMTVTGPISAVTSLTVNGGSDTRAADAFLLNSPLVTAGSVVITGFNRIYINSPITTTAGSGGAVTLSANAQATSTLTIIAAAALTTDGAVSLTASAGISMAGNITTNNQPIGVTSAGSGNFTNVTATGGSFSASFGGNFTGALTLLSFGTVTFSTTGNFAGQLSVGNPGIIQSITVGNSLTGSIFAKTLDVLTVDGSVAASATVMVHGSGEIGTMTVDGDLAGTVSGETITTINTGSLSGNVSAAGSGSIGTLTVQQGISAEAHVSAEILNTLTVDGNLAGTISVNEVASEPGTGLLQALDVGAIAVTGLVKVNVLTAADIHGEMAGQVIAAASLGNLIADAGISGNIVAGAISTVQAKHATGSELLQITQAGVERQLQASYLTTPPLNLPVFSYFYDATSSGNPQLSIRVANSDPVHTRFDLSLITDQALNGFDLARIDALAISGGPMPSGLRNLTVMGSLLPSLTPRALSFFGLPAGARGGVQLPKDALGSIAVQNNIVAGTISGASLQALAFGSFTVGGVTLPAQLATSATAARLIASGTALVQSAANTFSVPFNEARAVNLFLVTGGGGSFDSNSVLFTKQLAGGPSVTAQVTTALSGNSTVIQAIDLNGNGGTIQTAQLITTRITSTGPLSGLLLESPEGLIAAVTAPSIPGSIYVTNGPITSTIQTTVGNLGSAVTAANGRLTGTTTVHATGGISGQIISRGSLISQVVSNKGITGVIAAQGDIGVIQLDANGNAVLDASGHLTRYGGISCNGSFGGQVVALGNLYGDLTIQDDLTGRVAVNGRLVPGLAPTRFGILGNVIIIGALAPSAAMVSRGVIGDAAGGTVLTSGAIQGILAAEVTISFGATGSRNGAAIFDPATGANAAAIDAIFTHNHMPLSFDLTGLDLGGLKLILQKLAALEVVNGVLTEPVS